MFGHPEAASLTYLGLLRPTASRSGVVGIAPPTVERLYATRAHGLSHDTSTPRRFTGLPGTAPIGHVRYSTAGDTGLKNAQPLADRLRAWRDRESRTTGIWSTPTSCVTISTAKGSIFQTHQRHRGHASPLAISMKAGIPDRPSPSP